MQFNAYKSLPMVLLWGGSFYLILGIERDILVKYINICILYYI